MDGPIKNNLFHSVHIQSLQNRKTAGFFYYPHFDAALNTKGARRVYSGFNILISVITWIWIDAIFKRTNIIVTGANVKLADEEGNTPLHVAQITNPLSDEVRTEITE